MPNKYIISHVIPLRTIGGVEVAANSISPDSDVTFNVIYMADKKYQLLNPITHLNTFIAIKKTEPDVVVSSLWWTSIVCYFYKIFHNKSKLICFLHSQKRAHALDNLLTKLIASKADLFLCDSNITKSSNMGLIRDKRVSIVSFLHRKFTGKVNKSNEVNFIFWGRLSHVKRIDKAILFFNKVVEIYPNAKFDIYGPDFGEKNNLKNLIQSLDLENYVKIHDAIDNSTIEKYAQGTSFYLQLSEYEGMAMSVVEAMQLGLVPIVSPVGEISSYCKDMNNSIIFLNDGSALNKLKDVLENDLLESLSQNAILTWDKKEIYSDSIQSNIKAEFFS